jgi:ketosteroid isomerase-like protein
MTTRDTVLAYLRAIEAMDLAAVDALLHPDVLVIEHPNRLNPSGKRYDRDALRAAGERGRAAMASQRYEVRALLVDGDRAAVQIAWTGVLAAGREMHAELCSVIELRDGKVWRQEQYDCFVS